MEERGQVDDAVCRVTDRGVAPTGRGVESDCYIVLVVRDRDELIQVIGPCTKEASDVPAGRSAASAQV